MWQFNAIEWEFDHSVIYLWFGQLLIDPGVVDNDTELPS